MNITQTITNVRRHYSQSNNEAMKNPWFIALIGLVIIFLAVNIIFIVFAIYSNPGLVADDYYEKGREYENNVITLQNAQNNLNWQTKFEFPDQLYTNMPENFRFSAVDSRGVSIIDAKVKYILYRPSDAHADFVQSATQLAPGLYQSKINFPLPGIWDLTIKVTHNNYTYHHTHRVSVLTE